SEPVDAIHPRGAVLLGSTPPLAADLVRSLTTRLYMAKPSATSSLPRTRSPPGPRSRTALAAPPLALPWARSCSGRPRNPLSACVDNVGMSSPSADEHDPQNDRDESPHPSTSPRNNAPSASP